MVDFSPICTYKRAITTCQSKTTLKYIPIPSQHLPNSLLIKGEHNLKHSFPHSNVFPGPLADSGIPPTPGSAPSCAGTGPQSAPAWHHTGARPPGSKPRRDVEVWSLKNARGGELHLRVTIATLPVSRWSFPLHRSGANGVWHTADGPAVTRAAPRSGSI